MSKHDLKIFLEQTDELNRPILQKGIARLIDISMRIRYKNVVQIAMLSEVRRHAASCHSPQVIRESIGQSEGRCNLRRDAGQPRPQSARIRAYSLMSEPPWQSALLLRLGADRFSKGHCRVMRSNLFSYGSGACTFRALIDSVNECNA
jgi:hypothetical protein